MSDENRIDEPTGTEFVGHEWDGIEELNTPLPRWWLWTFYATVAWSLVYVVLYPAWPLVEQATEGTLGWSSRGDLAEDIQRAEAAQSEFKAQLAGMSSAELLENPDATCVTTVLAFPDVTCCESAGRGCWG